MPRPKTGNPVGRPPGALNRVGAVQRVTVSLAARSYSLDCIHYLASVVYNDTEKTTDRIMGFSVARNNWRAFSGPARRC